MKTQWIQLKTKMNIFYLTAGNPKNPPLVMLHGWPSSSALWDKIIPGLSKDFYVIAPDLPGHGQSDKPEEQVYDLNFLRTFILDFYDALGLDRASLVAHDLGGMAGLSFAVRHPERLDKFIIMNTSPFSNWPWALSLTISLLKQPWLTRFFLFPWVFKQVLGSGFFDAKLLTPQLVKKFQGPWVAAKQGKIAFSRTIAVPPEQMTESPESLAKINCPTLILWGKKDRFFPYGLAKKLNGIMPNAQRVGIDNAGHFLQEEQPTQITQVIFSFLTEK